MHRILLSGYILNNLGDDLMIKNILSMYPNCKFRMLIPDKYVETFLDFDNIKNDKFLFFVYRVFFKLKISKIKFYKFISFFKIYRTHFLIGGSLFIEPNFPFPKSTSYYASICELFETYVLGMNFGPYKSQEYKNDCLEKLEGCNRVIVRDRYTQSLSQKFEYAPDIVFLNKINVEQKDKTILISLIDFSTRLNLKEYGKPYFDMLKRFCILQVGKGYKIKLVSFCKAEGDENAINDFVEYCNEVQFDKIFYNGKNTEEILSEFSRAEIVIATRYHAMVLGVISHCSVLSVIYSNKISNVIDDLDVNVKKVELQDLESIKLEKLNLDGCITDLDKINELSKQVQEKYSKLFER